MQQGRPEPSFSQGPNKASVDEKQEKIDKEEAASKMGVNRLFSEHGIKPVEDDPYSFLGLNKDADSKTVRETYKKLSVKIHPDHNNNSEESTEAFKLLNNAFHQILK